MIAFAICAVFVITAEEVVNFADVIEPLAILSATTELADNLPAMMALSATKLATLPLVI